MSESRLFKPLTIGDIRVEHRIGMAPLTRFRASDDRVPTPMMKEYYSQRASTPGTLIITEGTTVSLSACGGFANAPGIWSEEQVSAWKTITDEVHSKGSFIFCQLFAMGRAGNAAQAEKEGIRIKAPSALAIDQETPPPEAMTAGEIQEMARDFVRAAENAIRAGFDGIECHGANGYLIDQFIQDTSNQRDDQYGGSIENRSRFLADILVAMVDAVGASRVGLRLSPWSTFQGMKMTDPIPQFTDIINIARKLNLAYLHFVESRISGSDDAESSESLEFVYKQWVGPLLIAGGYKPAEAQQLVDAKHPDKEIVVIFGRYFIANPDLVYRIKNKLELRKYDRETFYLIKSALGYVDYTPSLEYEESRKALAAVVH